MGQQLFRRFIISATTIDFPNGGDQCFINDVAGSDRDFFGFINSDDELVSNGRSDGDDNRRV